MNAGAKLAKQIQHSENKRKCTENVARQLKFDIGFHNSLRPTGTDPRLLTVNVSYLLERRKTRSERCNYRPTRGKSAVPDYETLMPKDGKGK